MSSMTRVLLFGFTYVFFRHCQGWSPTRHYVELATDTQYNYQSLQEVDVPLTPGTASFKFRVQASNDVHVALLTYDGETGQNIYEIVIGGWGNTRSTIRTAMQGTNRVEAFHSPLSPTEFRQFWISWESGEISVGTGSNVSTGLFMTFTDSSPHDVNYPAVTTGYGSTGSWQFESDGCCPFGPPIAGVVTGNVYQYKSLTSRGVRLTNGRNCVLSLVFWIRAANDAHIALVANDGNTDNNIYEVVIGGFRNGKSVIRESKQGANEAVALHKHLSPDQHLPFWISYDSGRIAVGYGVTVGRREFMSWTDTTPNNVKFVSISTGFGSDGHWLFCGSEESFGCLRLRYLEIKSPDSVVRMEILPFVYKGSVSRYGWQFFFYFPFCEFDFRSDFREQLISAQGEDVEVQKLASKAVSFEEVHKVPVCYYYKDGVVMRKTHLEEKLSHLSPEQQVQMSDLIHEFSYIFPDVPGRTGVVSHDIDIGDAVPVKEHPYRMNPVKHEILQKELKCMLDNDIIEPSESPWSSPCVSVPNSGGGWPCCADMKAVNALPGTDLYPILRVDDCIDHIGQARYISMFDLLKGFWQIPLTDHAKTILAFAAPDGLYQYKVMSFGLKERTSDVPETRQQCHSRP
ncbi:uncharacterized protein [Haliotis asinina]|uniref:uncharacterized protein n=1 Tax=Haliotis asinina TaxID=109174 RepID=UPI003531BFB2